MKRSKTTKKSTKTSISRLATVSLACCSFLFPGSPLIDSHVLSVSPEPSSIISGSESPAKRTFRIVEEDIQSPEPNMSDVDYLKLRDSLNADFDQNFKMLTGRLKDGGARTLFDYLRHEDVEKGGFVTIEGLGEVSFRVVSDPSDEILTGLIEAIEHNRPIPEPEKTLKTVVEIAADYLPDRPEKYAQAIVLFEQLRGMQRNPDQEKLYQHFKRHLPDVIHILRDKAHKRGDLFVQRPHYAFDWHHHLLEDERKPPSTRDKNNTVLGPPSVVVELRDGGLVVYGIKTGSVRYSETFDGL